MDSKKLAELTKEIEANTVSCDYCSKMQKHAKNIAKILDNILEENFALKDENNRLREGMAKLLKPSHD